MVFGDNLNRSEIDDHSNNSSAYLDKSSNSLNDDSKPEVLPVFGGSMLQQQEKEQKAT